MFHIILRRSSDICAVFHQHKVVFNLILLCSDPNMGPAHIVKTNEVRITTNGTLDNKDRKSEGVGSREQTRFGDIVLNRTDK